MVKIEGSMDEIRELLGATKSTRRRTRSTSKKPVKVAKAKKRKPMTRKTQLAINRGRKNKGLKPIKWKRKGK